MADGADLRASLEAAAATIRAIAAANAPPAVADTLSPASRVRPPTAMLGSIPHSCGAAATFVLLAAVQRNSASRTTDLHLMRALGGASERHGSVRKPH